MEILILGAWSGVVWWLAWATCSALHRRRQHLYSRRLVAWEREQRRQARTFHDMERARW